VSTTKGQPQQPALFGAGNGSVSRSAPGYTIQSSSSQPSQNGATGVVGNAQPVNSQNINSGFIGSVPTINASPGNDFYGNLLGAPGASTSENTNQNSIQTSYSPTSSGDSTTGFANNNLGLAGMLAGFGNMNQSQPTTSNNNNISLNPALIAAML
jgi:hypothetical protein